MCPRGPRWPLQLLSETPSIICSSAPLTYLAADGTLIEGVADLAFEEAGRWTVVDVKTDIEIGRVGLDRYKRQVALYAAAIARATSKPATAALLRV